MLLDVIKKHLEAYSAARWDDYKATLAADATYEEPPTQLKAQGPDAILQAVQRWKRAFPDLKATFVGGFESGDNVVAEIEWEGTHSGPLEGPLGTMPPTNKRGRLRAIEVMTIKGDKITEARHYFDLLTVLAQIGVMPKLGAPQPSEKPGAAASPKH